MRLFSLLVCLAGSPLFSAPAATLTQSIALPGVEGRLDHLALDAAGQRLFVAALTHGSVVVVDLGKGEVLRALDGLPEPQGLAYVAETKRLYVGCGGDDSLRVYDALTYQPITSIKLTPDVDNVRSLPREKRLYVGHGSGRIEVIDTTTHQSVGGIKLPAHPESFQLEADGARMFVNVPGARQVAVIDRIEEKIVARWSLGFTAANFPMALDEANHRLFVGCRAPSRLLVFNTDNGSVLGRYELGGECDDLFYDKTHRLIYASCGSGQLDIYQQLDADHYTRAERVETAAHARTCLVVAEQLFLAVPKQGETPAEIRIYQLNGPTAATDR